MTELEKYKRRFKRAYNLAVKYNQTSFMFDEQQVLVSYAKYYIEYLETLVAGKKK